MRRARRRCWIKAFSSLDRAIELDPRLQEPRFNRALALEAKGSLEQAKQAWREYLQLDPNSKWAEEAKRNLQHLEEPVNAKPTLVTIVIFPLSLYTFPVMSTDLVIRSRRVITPEGIAPAAVHISGGRIAALREWDAKVDGLPLVDAGDAVVMPGLVDAHVHVNEPGRTDWEGYTTATRAAAAGGVTTIVDMPLNSIPPTTTQAGFAEKLAAAEGQAWVDVAFWGGVVPGNTNQLAVLLEDGVRGFKCFLIHSGVDEFPHVEESDLLKAMPELARLGSVLLVHAELPGPIDRAGAELAGADPRAYDTFLRSRPRESENEAIAQMVRLCRETGARVHIVHHSSSDALATVAAAKAEGSSLYGRDLPALPDLCRRGHPARRDAL